MLKDAQEFIRQAHLLSTETTNQGFGFHKEIWASNTSNDFYGSLQTSKNAHAKFQVLYLKIAQSIAQMTKNQLYWVKSQLK